MAEITILTAGQPGGLVTPPATMPPGTILGNNGSGFAAPVPLTVPTLTAMLQPLGNFGVDAAVPGDAQGAGLIASNVVTPGGCTQGFNWYSTAAGQAFLAPGAAGQWCLDTIGNLTFGIAGAGGGTVAGQPISGFVGQLIVASNGAMTLQRNTLTVARDPLFPLEVATRQWVLSSIAAGAGAVISVFGRTGAVVAQAGDYAFSQISGVVTSSQLPLFTSGATGAVPASGGGASNFLRADGTWTTVSFSQITGSLSPAQMTLFTSSTAGAVPASGGGTVNFLRADGTWQPLPVTSVFGRAGAVTAQSGDYSFLQISGTVSAAQLPLFTATANGAVAASGGGTTTFLRADGTWAAPTGAGSSLTVGTTPIGGGATGQVLYDNAGILGVYTQASLTAYINAFTPTTAGTVPASGGGTTTFLRADGTWVVPPGGGATGRVLYNSAGLVGEYTQAQLTGQILAFTPTTAGVVSASAGGTTNFLRADGSWSPPPSAPVSSVFGRTGAVVAVANDYSFSQISGIVGPAQLPVFTASAVGAAPASGGGTTNFLRADGTWAAPATAAAPVTSVFGRSGAIVAASGDYSFSLISGTAAPAQLPLFSAASNGIVAASGGGTANFLRADGSWSPPPGLSAIPADTVVGNPTGASATPVAVTQSQLTALVNQFTSITAGTVPASGGGTSTFLRADGTWAVTVPQLKLSIQKFTTTGSTTYTPPAGLQWAIVESVGGGGGGGSATASATGFALGGGGGGSGGLSRVLLTAAQIGASQTVTVGAGGGTSGNGGASSFGTLCIADGGGGGASNAGAGTNSGQPGSAGTTHATAFPGLFLSGNPGNPGTCWLAPATLPLLAYGGNGGVSPAGGGSGLGSAGANSAAAGVVGVAGGGGGGGVIHNVITTAGGGGGGAGYVLVTEYSF